MLSIYVKRSGFAMIIFCAPYFFPVLFFETPFQFPSSPYLFTNIPAWFIQIPGLVLILINSAGIYLSFQPGLKEKILGNSCLWFVRYDQQILAFIFFWAVAVLYMDMSPVDAATLYGSVFAFGSWAGSRASVLTGAALVIAMMPFLLKIGEFPAKIEAQKARIENIQQQPLSEEECLAIQ